MNIKTRVTLIWPWSEQHQRTLELFPIGLGYLVSNINPEQFDVTILDCALDDLHPDSDEFEKALTSLRADLVGISWWSINTPIVEKTLLKIRKTLPEAILVAGGPHSTACASVIIEGGIVDFAFIGEAESSFSELLNLVHKNHGIPEANQLKNIPGLAFKDGGKTVNNPQIFTNNLDDIQGIDYVKTRLRDYHQRGYYYGAKLQKKAELTAPVMTARGCPFRCTFCMAPSIDGRQIRKHSVQHVLETIQMLYHEYGARYIAIIDDNFTINTKRALDICNAIAELNLKDLAIGTPNGIPLAGMTLELAKAMKRAGWREVMIAPESGSKRTLEAMKKPVDIDQIPGFVNLLHEAGLLVTAFFIIGYPDETLEDIAETESAILTIDFDFVGISIYQPLPGTDIYQQLVSNNTIPTGFIPGHYQEVTFKRNNMSNELLMDTYNRIWNNYREKMGMPIKNRFIAKIREHHVVSQFS